ELNAYAAALRRNGFFGPDSYYMNPERNADYARRAKNDGRIDLPALFLHGEYDYTCETVSSRLAEPMRRDCRNLSEVVIQSGHWMAQERPIEVNAAIARWLATAVPTLWPVWMKAGSHTAQLCIRTCCCASLPSTRSCTAPTACRLRSCRRSSRSAGSAPNTWASCSAPGQRS